MSERVDVLVVVDDTQAKANITAVKTKADEVTKQWKIDRAILIQQVREGLTLISSLMFSFRTAMSLFGQQIDPFFSALVGMVLATTSMLISSAAVISATVFGAPLGAVIFALAMSFNILTLGKLIADKEKTDKFLSGITQQLIAQAQPRGPRGGF